MNETIEWSDTARNGTRIEENGTLIRWITGVESRGNFEQSDSSLWAIRMLVVQGYLWYVTFKSEALQYIKIGLTSNRAHCSPSE
jgi:hypothetical protein